MSIQELITKHNLDRHRDFIIKSVAPCLRLSSTPVRDEDVPIGASKFGGNPDLPDGFEWPSCQPYPMTHLAQINCEEVSNELKSDLMPDSGIVHFFVQTDEEGQIEFPDDDEQNWRIVHSESTHLRRTEHPYDSEFQYSTKALEFHNGLSLPDSYDEPIGDLDETEIARYHELQSDLGGHEHQLFGYPSIIQPRDFGEAQLILQVLSEDDDFMFADCGYLYFTQKRGAGIQELDFELLCY